VYKGEFQGKPTIIKERFSKSYRHPILDKKIISARSNQEVKNIEKCKKCGIDVPLVYKVENQSHRIYLEMINGVTIKEYLIKNGNSDDLAIGIGKNLAIMHDAGIIHGDLTTSNMMLRESKVEKLVFIDFGLSCYSTSDEDTPK
jgi:TP53 regulating kinase-like protein